MKTLILISIILVLSCANKGALTGGEADKIPPTIIYSNPARDTVNISILPEFDFVFSERVDRLSFESSLYTVPIEKKRIKYVWDGWNEVKVLFVDSIKDFRTYQLIISKGLKDLHGVTSSQEYKIAFTRDSKLDRNFYKGFLNFRQHYENIRIALIDKNYTIKYIGDLSNNRSYDLNFIKDDEYRVIFFEDKDQNLKIDFSKEKIAIPNSSFKLNQKERVIDNVYFFKTDTLAPIIKSADSISKGILSLQIDDMLDLNKSKLFLQDSLNKVAKVHKILKKSNLYYAYYNAEEITFPAILKYERLQDIYGNFSDSIKQTIELFESQKTDTIAFEIKSINLRNNDLFKSLKPEIKIRFNSTLLWKPEWNKQITLKLASKEIELDVTQEAPDEIILKTKNELIPSNKYDFQFKTTQISNYYKSILKDSLIHYTVYTMSRNKLGSLSFQLNTTSKNKFMYNLFKYDSEFDLYKKGSLDGNKFNTIQNIEGGIYKIEIFEDLNNNGSLDLGSYKPYKLSEKIKFITDSIPIRSNWDRVLEEINFD